MSHKIISHVSSRLVAIFSIVIQFSDCYVACGQNPSQLPQRTTYNGASSNQPDSNIEQAPIRPILSKPQNTQISKERSRDSSFEPIQVDVSNPIAAETNRFAAIVSSTVESIFSNPIKTVGDRIDDIKTSLSEAVEEARDGITKAFHNAERSAAEKLRESQLYLSEKFRPLADTAMRIFERPGTTDKQRWDQLVNHVESTNLNNEDKREFFQKLVDTFSGKQK